jgi:Ni,Fe-hydrogenase III small subunit
MLIYFVWVLVTDAVSIDQVGSQADMAFLPSHEVHSFLSPVSPCHAQVPGNPTRGHSIVKTHASALEDCFLGDLHITEGNFEANNFQT